MAKFYILVFFDARDVCGDAFYQDIEFVFKRSFAIAALAVCVAIEANKDEFGTKYHKKVVISNDFVLFVIADVCFFVRFNC